MNKYLFLHYVYALVQYLSVYEGSFKGIAKEILRELDVWEQSI